MTTNVNNNVNFINATDIFYGVEIETVAPAELVQSGQLNIGGYHHPVQVPFLPRGWKASYDCSIDTSCGGYSCEIVSPKLKGVNGLNQIVRVCNDLAQRGFRVNRSTGVHISVDWGMTDEKTLDRLINAVAFCEAGIYATTGTHSRERGIYCRSVHGYGSTAEANDRINVAWHSARYHILNLTNLYNGQGRVEFRAFSGSLNPLKISAWVCLCVGIVQRAKCNAKTPKWTGSVNSHNLDTRFKGQSGAREFLRIQQFLNWQPALMAKKTAYGYMGERMPFSFAAMQAELKRLVKKYDGECA